MTTLPDINLLTGRQIEEVLKTCDSYLGKKLGLEGAVENTKLPITVSSLNLSWNSANDFEKDINLLTKEKDIRSAYATLYTKWEQKLAQEKSEKVEKTTLSEKELKPLEEESERRKAGAKESTEKAQKKQDEWLKLQKEKLPKPPSKEEQEKILEELKEKVVYATPQKPEPEINLTEKEESFANLAKQNPRVFEQKLAEDIINKNPEIFVSEELKPLADVIAVETTNAFIDPANKPVPTGVFAALTKYKESPEIQKTGVIYTLVSEEKQNLYREILNRTVGINLANKVLGFSETVYEFSQTPPEKPEGSFTVKLDDLQANSFACQESPLFQTFDNPLLGEAKTAASGQLKDFAFSKIASLPKQGFLGNFSRLVTSRSFDSIAPFLGLPTQMTYTGTSFFGKMITTFVPQYAPLITNFTAKLGIDIGIKALAPVTAKGIETGIASLAVKGAAGKAVGGVISKVLTVLGGLTSWATFGLSLIGGWLLGKVIEKIPWKKVLPWIVGIPVFVIVSPVAGVAVGLGTFWIISGLPIKAVGFRIGGFFARIGASMAITIGTPIIVAIVVFPILVAIILFIINSGAYIVPPSSLVGLSENPYIRVEKSANPAGPFKNSDIPLTVEYTIVITAKKSSLTHIKIVYECRVIKESSSPPCPAISGEIPNLDDSFTISPVSPYSFSYSVSYDSSDYYDSLITDTITVTADTSDGAGQTTSGSASIMIGNPPTKCFKPIGNNWPANYLANLQAAIVKITTDHPVYAAKTCTGGDIKIVYDPTPHTYWGFHYHLPDKDIELYSGGLGSQLNAEYILTHESAHHLSRINPALYSEYKHFDGVPGERPICSYDETFKPGEAFAEATALYGSEKTLSHFQGCSGTSGTFKENYPKHWEFENTKVFH